jgi:polar amino acid transport system substrate-binding protein/glutamate/aspartate transport system substrate-binding protein
MGSLSKALALLCALSFMGGGGLAAQTPTAAPPASTIDQIRASKTLRIAYDAGAPPFSYTVPGNAVPQGFSVELCRAVADQLKEQLKIPDLKVAYVPVTTVTRLDAIADNKADLLCDSTTATLSRRAKVDFSIPIFIDGASFAIGANGPQDFNQFAGKKIAVLPNTTTEQQLRRALAATHVTAEVVLVKTNQEGVDLLAKGDVAAYFADRSTLTYLLRGEKEASKLMLADTYLSTEPIALGLRRGDGDFRLAVDTALSHLYRRGQIVAIFKEAFGSLMSPSPLLIALYQVSALPD